MLSVNAVSINLSIKGKKIQGWSIGNFEILKDHKLAIFCSTRCPGSTILRIYDVAQKLRAENRTVIGGFHTPIEKECLRIFLKGTQNIIICPARGLGKMRIPQEWRKSLDAGRLLILSPFAPTLSRSTVDSGQRRNHFVADLGDEIFIAYAAPGSKTELFAKALKGQDKSILLL